jgi:thioredoxin reductase/NAD-dependent dihydropyrimidine dehydrogenase PreA subunit
VPLQAYEVVQAEETTADGREEEGRAHPVVRADLCVGCSTCVDACPEEGALRLVGKLAVVDPARCVGHGDCAPACPVGAIAFGTGDAVQRVEVPRVDAHFQSNVPGLYVVGELGGRGLIKNAVNEGRLAAEHAAASLPAGAEDAVDVDVAVVGAGPAGLSAGLELHGRGLRYLVLDQGTLADSIRKYPRHKLLLAEPVTVPLYGRLWVSDASKEALLKAWEAILAATGLRVRTHTRIETVRPEEGSFLLQGDGESWRARRVILAMGRRGTPRRLGVPGEEGERVFYDIVEMEAFQGRRVLVVGGGDSAVESALGLAHQPGCTVHLSYRKDGFSRVKARNLEKLEKAVAAGAVHLLLASEVVEIGAGVVRLRTAAGDLELPNDDVVVRIGGQPPRRFLESVGVEMVRKDIPLVGAGS